MAALFAIAAMLLIHCGRAIAYDSWRYVSVTYVEKLEPQPQLLVECGLMKLKPWRIRVSS